VRGWTGYTFDKELFPDHRAFFSKLKEKNLKISLNLHPAAGVRSYEEKYPEMCLALGRDPAEKKTIEFDFTDPDFINAYFDVLHAPYEKEGVDVWWIDWQQGKKSKLEGYDPLWGLNHYHTLDSAKDGKRPLILSRYAGRGSHRYPLGFSGDAAINWAVLRFQPYFTANAANVGFLFWSHDIGGHHFGAQHNNELYLRWIQFGVFSPILRLHSTKKVIGKEPWNFPAVEKMAEEFLRLRFRLIPYIYSGAYKAYSEGRPLCSPMYYGHPSFKEAYRCRDEYDFGGSLIVRPITSPINRITNRARRRSGFRRGGTSISLPARSIKAAAPTLCTGRSTPSPSSRRRAR
jgi:Alpha-glucosidases, family 31 of glycosyl hydrolases